MADHYSTLTYMHLGAARKMPTKRPYCDYSGKRSAAAKRERKAIAKFYRLLRTSPEHGPAKARLAHRYAVVSTGSEARVRTRNIARL